MTTQVLTTEAPGNTKPGAEPKPQTQTPAARRF